MGRKNEGGPDDVHHMHLHLLSERYEQCCRDKADLADKLSSVARSEECGASAPVGYNVEMGRRYQELREEYKQYRKRALAAIQEKEMVLAQLACDGPMRRNSSSIPDDPRLQYLKNLMLKYLCTDEFEAKEHMERAITAVLQFSDAERAFVTERRAESGVAWLAALIPVIPAATATPGT